MGVDSSLDNLTYSLCTIPKEYIIHSHTFVITSFGVSVGDDDMALFTIYILDTELFHKCPYNQRHISRNAKCTTNSLQHNDDDDDQRCN